jgi:hypothetical protein
MLEMQYLFKKKLFLSYYGKLELIKILNKLLFTINMSIIWFYIIIFINMIGIVNIKNRAT